MLQYYLITLGCQMNKNDSERIVGLLGFLGLERVNEAEEADLIIVNTCSVRQSAEDRVYGLIRNWQKLRERNPKLIIAITGCLPGRDKDGKLKKKIKDVDLFFGIEELPMLPKWLGGLGMDFPPPSSFHSKGGIEGVFEVNPTDYLSITPSRPNKFQAFITIQTGCDNYCTYCVVPYSRGRQKNRPLEDILDEIKQAVKGGCKEVILLGQVVNNYKILDRKNITKENPFIHVDRFRPFPADDDFAALLWEINQIPGIERVHFTASDPRYFSDAQIKALTLPKMVNYLHLPVQSGANEILKKMNRKYIGEQYINLIKKIRVVKPDIAIGTDIIVGFCGETEEHFQNTINLYKQCDFNIAYLAMYSERSGTVAANVFKDDVPHQEKKRRWRALQDLMEGITFRKNKKYQGRIVSVLVESCEEGICFGQSSEMKLVQFLGTADLVGRIVEVKITQTDVWVLRGKIRSSE